MDGLVALLVAPFIVLVPVAPATGRVQEASDGAAVSPRTAKEDFFDRLTEIMRTAPPPEIRRGDRSLTGRVVTDLGEPLAGVLLRATRQREPSTDPSREAFEDTPPTEPTFAETMRRWGDSWFTWRRDTHETTTASDGTFAFTDLVDGRFELQAWRVGFTVTPQGESSPRATWVDAGGAADFVATPCMVQTIALHMPDGTAPDRATLHLQRYGDSSGYAYQTWTTSQPSVHLAAGDWYVTAAVGGQIQSDWSLQRAWFASKPTLVTITPPLAPEPVTLELRGVPAIEGTITMPAGERRSSVSVSAVALAPGQEADLTLLAPTRGRRSRRGHDASTNWSSDRGTTFRLAPIEPGRWFVAVMGSDRTTPLTTAEIEVGDTVVTHAFTLPPSKVRDELRVRAFDSDGALLRSCTFELATTRTHPDGHTDQAGYGGIEARRTLDGSFALARERLGADSVLFARHPRFGVRRIEAPLDAEELVVRFMAPAVPVLRLDDYTENVGGRRVEIELDCMVEPAFAPQPVRFDSTAITAAGTVELGKLEPGAYRIRLFADSDPDDSRARFEVAAATSALTAGPCTLTLPFPPLNAVLLKVPAGTKGTFLLTPSSWTSAGDDRARRHAEPDADGMFTFADVPPGLYEVRGPRNEFMQIAAPAREVIVFVAQSVNALRVVIADPDGRLANASLETGDWIVAIDGREFANREELDGIRQSLRADEVTLTVERAGERFEIVLARRLLQDAGAAGGFFNDSSR